MLTCFQEDTTGTSHSRRPDLTAHPTPAKVPETLFLASDFTQALCASDFPQALCTNNFGTQSAQNGVRNLYLNGRKPARPLRGKHRKTWKMDYIKVPDLPWWITRKDYTRPASNGGALMPPPSGSAVKRVPGPTTSVSNPPTAPVHSVTSAGQPTGAMSAAVRGPHLGPACHQCKCRKLDPKMTCAGKKMVRGKPCTLGYCKRCMERQ